MEGAISTDWTASSPQSWADDIERKDLFYGGSNKCEMKLKAFDTDIIRGKWQYGIETYSDIRSSARYFVIWEPENVLSRGESDFLDFLASASEEYRVLFTVLPRPLSSMQGHKDKLLASFPYIDFLFSTECELMELGYVLYQKRLTGREVAKRISAFPKILTKRPRTVVVLDDKQSPFGAVFVSVGSHSSFEVAVPRAQSNTFFNSMKVQASPLASDSKQGRKSDKRSDNLLDEDSKQTISNEKFPGWHNHDTGVEGVKWAKDFEDDVSCDHDINDLFVVPSNFILSFIDGFLSILVRLENQIEVIHSTVEMGRTDSQIYLLPTSQHTTLNGAMMSKTSNSRTSLSSPSFPSPSNAKKILPPKVVNLKGGKTILLNKAKSDVLTTLGFGSTNSSQIPSPLSDTMQQRLVESYPRAVDFKLETISPVASVIEKFAARTELLSRGNSRAGDGYHSPIVHSSSFSNNSNREFSDATTCGSPIPIFKSDQKSNRKFGITSGFADPKQPSEFSTICCGRKGLTECILMGYWHMTSGEIS